MNRFTALALACMAIGSPSAQAGLVLATNPAVLAATDHVAWDQLGADGQGVGKNFSATSSGGKSVSGGFAGAGGFTCNSSGGECASTWASNEYSGDAPAFGTATSLLARSGNTYDGAGSGALSFVFGSGVSAVGAYVLSDVAFQNYGGTALGSFTALLSLYNGNTLLGSVSASSSDGQPIYLGAFDTDGPLITRADYSLTAIGEDRQTPPTSYSLQYDMQGGFSDPVFCASTNDQDLRNIANALRCPQKAGGLGLLPRSLTPAQYQQYSSLINRNIVVTPQGGGMQYADHDADHLAAIEIGTLDFVAPQVPAAVAVPEPASWALALLALGAMGTTTSVARQRRSTLDRSRVRRSG